MDARAIVRGLGLAAALATAGCAASTERDLDAGPADAAPSDGGPPDACARAVPRWCGPDDGAIDLRAIGYERAWITMSHGFFTGLSLTLAGADGLGCGARSHYGDAWVSDDAWVGTHDFELLAEDTRLDPIAATLRVDVLERPPEDGTLGRIVGTLELRPESGEAVVRTGVTLPICRSSGSI